MTVLLSCVLLFATPWTVAHQAPLSMEFSRQEYWSGLPFPLPGGLPNPGIEPGSLALQADSLPSEPPRKLGNNQYHSVIFETASMYHISDSFVDYYISFMEFLPTVVDIMVI